MTDTPQEATETNTMTDALARIAEIRRDPSNYAAVQTATVCIRHGLFREDGILVDGAGEVLELVNGVEEIARLEKATPATFAATRFRKKPVVIDAFLWDGTPECAFNLGEWHRSFGPILQQPEKIGFHVEADRTLHVVTLEDGKQGQAKHVADVGDWIIRGVKGEYYPCKPDIFAATYDPA